MARIRTIKPEFWVDEKLAPLPPITRLVFLGLISQADDAGRLVDNVRLMDGLLFPETEESSRESLDILASLKRITRYTSESGQRLIQITNWEDHQKVDRPSKYVLPPPPPEALAAHGLAEHSRDTRETLATDSRDPIVPTLDLGPTTLDRGAGGSGSSGTTSLKDWMGSSSGGLDDFRRRPDYQPSQEPALYGLLVVGGNAEGYWKTPDGSRVPTDHRPALLSAALSEFAASSSRYSPAGISGFLRSTIGRWTEQRGGGSDDSPLYPGGPTQKQLNDMPKAEYKALLQDPRFIAHQQQEAA